MMNRFKPGLAAFILMALAGAAAAAETPSIRPWDKNPWYWEYGGEPLVLIGGSDQDNLFQWTGEQLTDHLDLLTSVGGNYVRNTMSDRDEGNVYAFRETEAGVYDLSEWNEEYWDRLEFFLRETRERGAIVQLTLWDTFDIASGPWSAHPWNPDNNVNYGPGVIGSREDFYDTVETGNNEGLHHQANYIDKLLSVTFAYGHVLYNINNESSEGAVWENHWAEYIRDAAAAQDREVYVTSMQFDPSDSVRHAMTFRDIYGFVEISQNNQDSRGGTKQGHWENILTWRQRIASHSAGPMPMNNEKVYGALDGRNYSAGTETEAVNRFWRNIFAGCASSRFHRPAEPRAWGAGLNERVQTNLQAMRMLLDEFDIFAAAPRNDLLSRHVAAPASMEAYASANIGAQYAIYFPPGRFVADLDPWVYMDELVVRWLDIDQLTWSEPETVAVRWEGDRDNWGDRGAVTLKTPSNRPYVALLEAPERPGDCPGPGRAGPSRGARSKWPTTK